jgi:hypothetical protein
MPIYEIVVGSSNFSFVHSHIPKTGGVAVSHFFSTKLGARVYYGYEMNRIRPMLRCHPHHYHYAILNELFLLEKATISFCIVRHPIARIESDYIWAMTKSPMKDHWMPFDDWVSHVFEVYTHDPYFVGNHIRPQHEFIGPKIKNVFKYEDGLNVAVKHVLEMAGLQLESDVVLDEKNTRNDSGSDPSSDPRLNVMMQDETRQKIMRFYNKDFTLFGYF